MHALFATHMVVYLTYGSIDASLRSNLSDYVAAGSETAIEPPPSRPRREIIPTMTAPRISLVPLHPLSSTPALHRNYGVPTQYLSLFSSPFSFLFSLFLYLLLTVVVASSSPLALESLFDRAVARYLPLLLCATYSVLRPAFVYVSIFPS